MRRCTDITIILDKSESMTDCHAATIELINSFIKERHKDPEDCILSLVQFSSSNLYGDPLTRTFAGLPAKNAPRLTPDNYHLGGMTALLDAMGVTIVETGKRLAAMPEAQRPDRVLIVIMTDGQENHSKKFISGQIVGMTNHQRDHYRWEFMFLGADMDSITAARQAQALGVYAQNTLNYRKSSTHFAGQCMTQAVEDYAGPAGSQGPCGPAGPGIFTVDEAVMHMAQALRQEADGGLGSSIKMVGKKTNGKHARNGKHGKNGKRVKK